MAKESRKRKAIVFYNLGGPTDRSSIKPFLFNLFNDSAILQIPNPFRFLLAKLISSRRFKEASEIYEHLGGSSPLLDNTRAQAKELEGALLEEQALEIKDRFKVFIVMRYWHPRVTQTLEEIAAFDPHEIISLPLYPQYSMTTTGSSFAEFESSLKQLMPNVCHKKICCYPQNEGFVEAICALTQEKLLTLNPDKKIHLLFSAHGLPKKVIAKGDPYQRHVEETVEAVLKRLKGVLESYDYEAVTCYQSRVGPLEWIGPATDDEIKRAGLEKAQVLMIPVAFVSEHSETLVELDVLYADLAKEVGVSSYVRVPTVATHPKFIAGLKRLVLNASGGAQSGMMTQRRCSGDKSQCPNSSSCAKSFNVDASDKRVA